MTYNSYFLQYGCDKISLLSRAFITFRIDGHLQRSVQCRYTQCAQILGGNVMHCHQRLLNGVLQKDKDREYEYMVSHKIHLHIIWVIFIGPIYTDFGTVFKERFCANANKNFYFETFCKQLS